MNIRLKEIMTAKHEGTQREYTLRNSLEKPLAAEVAKKFAFDYWDGDRKFGYGGYFNDGRWNKISESFIKIYNLHFNDRILDIGCGKGFLLEAFKEKHFAQLAGLEISEYALTKASPDIKEHITLGNAKKLPFQDRSFDLVVSINTLHNLELPDLVDSLKEIQRVTKKNSYLCVESYRNEDEKWNLMQWQLTCECFYTPKEWAYIFDLAGYTGDYEFIFFN